MDKIIWVVEPQREKMLDMQRKINSFGGMKAMCMLTFDAMKKTIADHVDGGGDNSRYSPSLIMLDYDLVEKDEAVLNVLKAHPKLAGVPLYFVVGEDADKENEEYYFKGAMVVLGSDLGKSDIIRIERAAWQYEITRSYERILQKQASEMETTKEIKKLNDQLANRNQFLHNIFGKYFSDEFIEVMLEKKENELIGGDRREIAVLLSDLRGFSSIVENMSSESMTDLLNCFFGTMMDIVNEYKGTVIEYTGDGILAVFGTPIKSDDYCENAIAAAVAMQLGMEKVNKYCEDKGYSKLSLGVAVHCGEGFVGNIGTEKMMRYNVIGNVVNICSRIEGCSIGGQVLASEEIVERSKVPVEYSKMPQIFAKGMSAPINICSVTGIKGEYDCRFEEVRYDDGYKPKEDIEVEIFPIANKLVDECGAKVIVKSVFCDRLNVVMCDEGVEIDTSELFSDVELRMPGIAGVYAKITRIENNEMTLSFTRTCKAFDDFLIQLISSISGEETDMINIKTLLEQEERFVIAEVSDARKFDNESADKFALAWSVIGEDVHIKFCSVDSSIRAIEFMDYLVGEYSFIKGSGNTASAVISKLLLKDLMTAIDTTQMGDFFEKKAHLYFHECEWIFAEDYSKLNKEELLSMPKYEKKTVYWAYVKTTDAVPAGEKFLLKSLENETDVELESTDDLYIMIGCRGEVYYIDRDKFERTYTPVEKEFDIYEQLPEYMPEIKLASDESFISLDDKAKMCLPKGDNVIYAMPLTKRTKVFSESNKGEYFVGREGDYLAMREDDMNDIYIIQKEIFEDTYQRNHTLAGVDLFKQWNRRR